MMSLTFCIRLFHRIRGMRNAFASSVKRNLSSFRDTEMRGQDSIMYVFDEKFQNALGQRDGRTYLTPDDTNKDNALTIENLLNKEIVHICIDGGVIQYGKDDYVGDGQPHGRLDCMVFSDDKLVFVELKMNMQTNLDKRRWEKYSDALNQLQDFICNYFYPKYAMHNDSIENYYKRNNYYSVICMKTAPNIGDRNTQRQNRQEAFRIATNMKVISTTKVTF